MPTPASNAPASSTTATATPPAPATEPKAPAVSTDQPTRDATAAPSSTPPATPAETSTAPPSAAPDAAGTPATEAAPVSAPAPDWREALKAVDVREILKDERIAGHIGDVAEKRAQKLVREALAARDAEQAAKAKADADAAEAQRLNDLREKDAWAWSAELKAKEDVARQQADAWANLDALLHARFYELPLEEQQKLGGKLYPGTPAESRQAFLRDLGAAERRAGQAEAQTAAAKALADAKAEADKALAVRIEAERKKWESEELPAKVKEGLSATNGREPSPDGGGGGAPADTLISRAEFAQHEKDYGWIRANKDRINRSLAAGSLFK